MEASEYFGLPYICQFQYVLLNLAVNSAFYSPTNQIFYWVDAEQSLSKPAWGNWMITVVKLMLFCQAGTSPATKAWLFHDPDSTTGTVAEVPL